MARVPVSTDAFPSSIDGGWTNPPGGFASWTWISSGVINPSVADPTRCLMVRASGTYNDNQYCKGVGTVVGDGTFSTIELATRCNSSATDMYLAFRSTFSGSLDRYSLYKVVGGSFTALSVAGTTDSYNGAITTVLESDGTDHYFYTDEGSGEVLRLSASDAAVASGRPALSAYANATTKVAYNSFEGGYLGSAGGFLAAWASGSNSLISQGEAR